VLELDRIGRDDNFFELGGHSLLATQVVSRIRDVFAADVSLHALFAGPTIAQLATAVAAATRAAGDEHEPPLTATPRAAFAAALDADGRLQLTADLRDRLAKLAS
jgi:acyl carrier protein